MSRSKIVTLTTLALDDMTDRLRTGFQRSEQHDRKSGHAGLCKTPGTLSALISLSRQGYFCNPFNGATCNLSDPATGGVRSGTLEMCSESGDSANSGGEGT